MSTKLTLLEQIRSKTGNVVETTAHADALARLIVSYCDQSEYTEELIDAGSALMAAMQQVIAADAGNVLRATAMPAWVALFDRMYPTVSSGDSENAWRRNLLFLLKIFALYGGEAELQRITAAARDGFCAEDFLWSVIFGELGETPDDAAIVISALHDPLPTGFIAVALLDLANRLATAAHALPHPFASAAGHSRLLEYLQSADPAHTSYAHSATTALAYVDAPGLLALAVMHAAPTVRLEAMWVAARAPEQDAAAVAALEALVIAAADPRTSRAAIEYLRELGHLARVPTEVNTLDHWALTELSAWLGSPYEHGRPPDALTIVDHRRMWWPPTNDERDLWLILYAYHDVAVEAVGLVGSVTGSLEHEAFPSLPPEDLYGLYCCAELQDAKDPRAPRHRTALAGRKMLGFKRR